jgi:adenylate cyclase
MKRALLIDPDNLNMRYNFACALAKYLDDAEGAIAMLESTFCRVKGGFGNAEFDPDLESIRDDPRFQNMLAAAKKRPGIKEAQSAAAISPAAS